MPFGHLGVATWQHKCYADKSEEEIDALKDNIREAIGEIQLHTIYSMLKNLNVIIFNY